MIAGRLAIEQFGYQVVDAEGKKVVNGKATEESTPLKLLVFQEIGGMQFLFTFTPQELEHFIANISGTKIIPATFIPPVGNPYTLRN
jgi:hypothetical protein